MVKMQITFARTHKGCKECITIHSLNFDVVSSKYKQCGDFV